jgi:hypothetical protein
MSRFLNNYGMLGVLILLAALFSVLTFREQQPEGASAARALASDLSHRASRDLGVLIVSRGGGDDALFADLLSRRLLEAGFSQVRTACGDPAPGAVCWPPTRWTPTTWKSPLS